MDRGLTADRVLDVLTNLFLTRGVPRHIRSDNGPEFIATAIRRHGEQAGLEMLYIEPGSPWENGFAESFFSRLRDELLNCEEFANLAEARWFARRRQEEHNHERPHSSLGYQTPVPVRRRVCCFRSGCACASSSTREDKKRKRPCYPFPNPYSHNPWTKNRGQVNATWVIANIDVSKLRCRSLHCLIELRAEFR